MYRGAIYESVSNADLASFVGAVVKTYGIDLSIQTYNGDGIVISKIVVPTGKRSSGIGTNVIKEIIQYANANNLKIYLNPSEKSDGWGTTSRSRLIEYYKRFGFVENKGKNRDYSTSYYMYRLPPTLDN